MTPVKQTVFEPVGNCFQCCVASLLDMPLDDVPHFVAMPGSHWMNMSTWLKQHDLTYVAFKHSCENIDSRWGHHIIIGKSPRKDCKHAVIGLNGEPIFDPHPDMTYLSDEQINWTNVFIMEKR